VGGCGDHCRRACHPLSGRTEYRIASAEPSDPILYDPGHHHLRDDDREKPHYDRPADDHNDERSRRGGLDLGQC